MTLLAAFTLRASAILAVALLLTALLRRQSAALRHLVLACAVFAAVILVPLGSVLPGWSLGVGMPAAPVGGAPSTAAAPGLDIVVTANAGRAMILERAIVGVWGAGVAIAACVLLAGFTRLLWATSRARVVRSRAWLHEAEEISRSYGLNRHAILLVTDTRDLLATWGFLRQRVLLPEDAERWTADRVHVVLRHELAHVRRRDWPVQVAAEALRAVCWFNPIVWITCARLRLESERACDDLVIGGGVAPYDYARHLLALAKECAPRRGHTGAAMPMLRRSMLERRVQAMLNPRLNRTIPSRWATSFVAVALVGLAVPIAAARAAQNAPLPLAGSVYDPTGALVPNVELRLEDAHQHVWQTKTDGSGRFEFPSVEPGTYVLEASLFGFHPLRQALALKNAADWDRAITLQIEEVQEQIVVSEPRVAPPQSPAPQATLVVGGNIRAPRKLLDVRPIYPETMREAGRQGDVALEAIIGRDGTVSSVRPLSADVHPDFAKAAMAAVRQWRFDPTRLNGVPVEVRMRVSVRFSLSE